MFFPLSDDDRLLVRPAYVTWILVGLNLLGFLLQVSSPEFTLGYAAIPAEITRGEDLVAPVAVQLGSVQGRTAQMVEIPQAPGPRPIQLTLLTAMFMHAGIMHLMRYVHLPVSVGDGFVDDFDGFAGDIALGLRKSLPLAVKPSTVTGAFVDKYPVT